MICASRIPSLLPVPVMPQCSKLRFKFVHPPGAEGGKCLHPEFKSSAHKLRYPLNIRENGAHAGCTTFKIMHAGCRVHP